MKKDENYQPQPRQQNAGNKPPGFRDDRDVNVNWKRTYANKARVYKKNFNGSDSSASDSNLEWRRNSANVQPTPPNEPKSQANPVPAAATETQTSQADQPPSNSKENSRSSSREDPSPAESQTSLPPNNINPGAFYYPPMMSMPYPFAAVNQNPQQNIVMPPAPFMPLLYNANGQVFLRAPPVYPGQTSQDTAVNSNEKPVDNNNISPVSDEQVKGNPNVPVYPYMPPMGANIAQYISPETQGALPPPLQQQPYYQPYYSYALPGQPGALPYQPFYAPQMAMPAQPSGTGYHPQLVVHFQPIPQSSALTQQALNLNGIIPASGPVNSNGTRVRKKSCYNCGSMSHDASECKEPTIDATLQSQQFRLNFKP